MSVTGLSPQKALAAARFWAVTKMPYFAQALFSMVPREVPDGTLPHPEGTFAMNDAGILFYENRALDRWTTPEAGSVLIHECLHWIRKHGARAAAMGAADHYHRQVWNYAADFEINDDLHDMKLPLPDGGGAHPAKLQLPTGKLAETYYQDLLRMFPQEPPKACPCCGSGAGNPFDGEPDSDPAGRAEAEVEIIRTQTAQAVAEHVQRNGMGSVPQGLRRWAEESLKPAKVDWRQKLARIGRARIDHRPGAVAPTHTRMHRRQGGLGYGINSPMLTSRNARKAEVVLAIDTSGSMGQKEIERAIVESLAVLKSLNQPVRLVACDCAVHSNTVVRTPQELMDAVKGGGGTDFRPVFDAVKQMQPPPEVVIFITDGGGYAPAVPPNRLSVIWLLVGAHRCRPMLPNGGSINWGDFIEVDE